MTSATRFAALCTLVTIATCGQTLAAGCRKDGVYVGQTSQLKPIELQIEGKALKRIRFEGTLSRPTCSSAFQCPVSGTICSTLTFDPPIPIKAARKCRFSTGVACPSPACPLSSCEELGGRFRRGKKADRGTLEAALKILGGSNCYLATGDVTWTATYRPGATPTNCPASLESRSMESTEDGRTTRMEIVELP